MASCWRARSRARIRRGLSRRGSRPRSFPDRHRSTHPGCPPRCWPPPRAAHRSRSSSVSRRNAHCAHLPRALPLLDAQALHFAACSFKSLLTKSCGASNAGRPQSDKSSCTSPITIRRAPFSSGGEISTRWPRRMPSSPAINPVNPAKTRFGAPAAKAPVTTADHDLAARASLTETTIARRPWPIPTTENWAFGIAGRSSAGKVTSVPRSMLQPFAGAGRHAQRARGVEADGQAALAVARRSKGHHGGRGARRQSQQHAAQQPGTTSPKPRAQPQTSTPAWLGSTPSARKTSFKRGRGHRDARRHATAQLEQGHEIEPAVEARSHAHVIAIDDHADRLALLAEQEQQRLVDRVNSGPSSRKATPGLSR